MSVVSTAIREYAERIKERYRLKTYQQEVRSGKAPKSIRAASTLAEAIHVLSNGVKEDDAVHAAAEIEESGEPLQDLESVIDGMDDVSLNYLYSDVSYAYFGRKYLAGHFKREFSVKYHEDYFSICRDIETHNIVMPAAVAGPRDFGKSTIGNMMLPLHCVIFPVWVYYADGRQEDISKRFIAHVSIVEAKGSERLESICNELENNDDIRRDFGEFYKDPDAKPGKSRKPWSKVKAVTLNGKRLEVFGRKGKIRGTLWNGFRISLIIGDDLEDDENSDSPMKQERDFKWMTRVVIPSISSDNGNVLILGNRVNPNGLNDRIIRYGEEKGWRVRTYKFYEINEAGDKVYTWPEYFNAEMEAIKREMSQDEGFEVEYLQNPDAQYKELTTDSFDYYLLDDILPKLRSMYVYAAIDPASTVTKRSDYTAIVGIAYDPKEQIIYVLPSVNDKIPLKQQAHAVLDYHARWNTDKFGVEVVQYQAALQAEIEEEAKEQDYHIKLEPLRHESMGSKRSRIGARLFSRISSRRIKFIKGDKIHALAVNQLINLRTTQNDDLADALEMAVRLRDLAIQGARPKRKIRASIC